MERNRHLQVLRTVRQSREFMMLNFRESGHPVSRATSALERRTFKSKVGGKLSLHFCGDFDTVEVIFCTVVSVNQISIYGAAADVCEEYIPPPASTGQPVASAEKSESLVSPAELLNVQKTTSDQLAGTG